MKGPDDIEAYHEEVLRRWADGPRHTRFGMQAEYAAVKAMRGRVLDEAGEEVRLTMHRMSPLVRQLAWFGEELPPATRHPFNGANRKARRAAGVKRIRT